MSLYICYNGTFINESDHAQGCDLAIRKYHQASADSGDLKLVRYVNADLPDLKFASQTTPSIAWTEHSPKGRLVVSSTNQDDVVFYRIDMKSLGVATAEVTEVEDEHAVSAGISTAFTTAAVPSMPSKTRNKNKKIPQPRPVPPPVPVEVRPLVRLTASRTMWKNQHAHITFDSANKDVDILQNLPAWRSFTVNAGYRTLSAITSQCVPTLVDVPIGLGYTFMFYTSYPTGATSYQMNLAVLDDESYAQAATNDFTRWTVYGFPPDLWTTDSFSAVVDDDQVYCVYRGREGQIFTFWFALDANGFPVTEDSGRIRIKDHATIVQRDSLRVPNIVVLGQYVYALWQNFDASVSYSYAKKKQDLMTWSDPVQLDGVTLHEEKDLLLFGFGAKSSPYM